MSTFPHPNFPGLVIIVGDATPQQGSFYATKPGRTLSHIANLAYGNGKLTNVLRINNTAWNRANCVYRKTSTSCYSSIVSGHLAAQQKAGNPGAWLSMCQKDKNPIAMAVGSQYQVVWIPTLSDEQPSDLVLAPPVTPRTPYEPDPGVSFIKPPTNTIKIPVTSRVPVDDSRGGSSGGGDDGAIDSGRPVTVKAGFPMWLGIGLGVLALGAVVVIGGRGMDKTKKSGKKR